MVLTNVWDGFDSFCAASEHARRMLFNLLRWLDASPAHYWLVAWSAADIRAVIIIDSIYSTPQRRTQHVDRQLSFDLRSMEGSVI